LRLIRLEVAHIGKLIESSIKRLERVSFGLFLADSRSIMSGGATDISSESDALLSVTQSSTTTNIHRRHNPRLRGSALCLPKFYLRCDCKRPLIILSCLPSSIDFPT
jgi:hypothetical protein